MIGRATCTAIGALLMFSGGSAHAACGKITACPAASLPLSGAEKALIIQGGADKQVAVGDMLSAVAGVPTVATNAALKLAATSLAPTVYREGFATAGDGGAATYNASASVCPVNGGNGDDGKWVKGANGLCWIADFSGIQPTPKIWGCKGDGVADDTQCVIAAMAALPTATLWTGPYNYRVTGNVRYGGKLVGEHSSTVGGFVAGAINLNLLTLTAWDAEVDGVYFNMAPFTNTAGAAIDAATVNVNANRIHDNYITGPFVGIDLAKGALKSAVHNSVINIQSNGSGIRVGHGTTNAGTIETQVAWNWLSGDPGATNVACVTYEDVGGIQHSHNTAAQCSTKLIAGASQIIAFGFIDGELGDFNATGGTLQIDTTAASAKIYSLEFNGSWAASSLLGDCYDIRNSGGGLVTGIKFNSPRAYNCHDHGMLIGAGAETITNVEVNDPSICGTSGGTANAANGITVQSVNNINGKITGGHIGNGCDNQIGPVMGTGIYFGNASPGWQVSNVDLRQANGAGGAIGSTLPYGAGTRWINNPGYNPTSPFTITVGASPYTYTPGPAPETVYLRSGTVSAVTINGATVCTASPCTIDLNPLQQAVVTYSVLPTMVSAIHP